MIYGADGAAFLGSCGADRNAPESLAFEARLPDPNDQQLSNFDYPLRPEQTAGPGGTKAQRQVADGAAGWWRCRCRQAWLHLDLLDELQAGDLLVVKHARAQSAIEGAAFRRRSV